MQPTLERRGGYHQSHERDDGKWFTLQIRLNGKAFSVRVSPSKFYNSPRETAEFNAYFHFLEGGAEILGDADEEGFAMGSADATDKLEICVEDCFNWAVGPFLPVFRRLAPQPLDKSKITLQDLVASESFECELGAINDVLAPWGIASADAIGSRSIPPFKDASAPWTTVFPSFSPSQVEIISDDLEYILDEEPTHVRADGIDLFYKSLDLVGEVMGRSEIEKYEQIERANFEAKVRTSRLFGIVQDNNTQLVGLLLHPIEEKSTLADVLDSATPATKRELWAKQIEDTLAALHGAGIVWGDVKPGNIIIDVHGDAWIIDFGGGHTQGWVDEDKAGTKEGDLQGLRRVLEFISSGNDEHE